MSIDLTPPASHLSDSGAVSGGQVNAALDYFHDHHDSILAAIEAAKSPAERHRGPEPVSRDELLRRRAVAQVSDG